MKIPDQSNTLKKLFDNPKFNTPLTDEEYKELMKFDEPREEIPIEQVEFRIETVERITKDFDLENFMKEEIPDA